MDLRRLALAGALVGCYVGLDDGAPGDLDGPAETETSGGSGDNDESGESGEVDEDPELIGPAPLRRLTRAEVVASVQDLLEVDVADVAEAIPADPSYGGFSNNAELQALTLAHASAYQKVAEAAAERVDPATLVDCDPADVDCMESFLASWLPRAFRRPVGADEVDAFASLGDGADALPLALRGVLQSPHFLFLVERGAGPPDDAGRVPLTGYEIASRLSFFLWKTTPDTALLDAAASGALDTADGVEQTAVGMLADPRAERSIAVFVTEWLRLTDLATRARSADLYPEWSAALRQSMTDEVVQIGLDHLLAPDADALDIFDPGYGYADIELAGLYGVQAPAGGGLTKLPLGAAAQRGGVLSTAGFLAATTPGDVTNPIVRGAAVWELALCRSLPPPGNVDVAPVTEAPSKAEWLEEHRVDPACAGCHDLLDPIGLGLELFDALGRTREIDELGSAVSGAGEVAGEGGGPFVGGRELGQLVRDHPDAPRCLATMLFRFARGRTETADDDAELDAVTESFVAGERSFAAMVAAIAASDGFRYRLL